MKPLLVVLFLFFIHASLITRTLKIRSMLVVLLFLLSHDNQNNWCLPNIGSKIHISILCSDIFALLSIASRRIRIPGDWIYMDIIRKHLEVSQSCWDPIRKKERYPGYSEATIIYQSQHLFTSNRLGRNHQQKIQNTLLRDCADLSVQCLRRRTTKERSQFAIECSHHSFQNHARNEKRAFLTLACKKGENTLIKMVKVARALLWSLYPGKTFKSFL